MNNYIYRLWTKDGRIYGYWETYKYTDPYRIKGMLENYRKMGLIPIRIQ